MSREILFRGHNGKNFVYGDLVHDKKGAFITNSGLGHLVIVNSESIGQFTGLTDKNGVKIFEEDVVKGSWETIGSIYFDADFLQFRIKLLNGHNREIDYYGVVEVVGNVFENPELIEDL